MERSPQPGLISDSSPAQKLRRVLTLYDLIVYGIILIMPIAAVPLFGLAQKLSNGHAITTILLAMVAMTLTAFSYGRMAALYPVAGSAYSYVGRTLNQHLGFLAGWAMMLDYLLIPLLCIIYGSLTLQRLIPAPYWMWAAIFAIVITGVNLKGIRTASWVNLVLMLVMCVVIIVFMGLAVRFLFAAAGWQGLLSIKPFYDRATFSIELWRLEHRSPRCLTGGSTGSPRSPKKWRTRAATFPWQPYWSASLQVSSAASRFILPS